MSSASTSSASTSSAMSSAITTSTLFLRTAVLLALCGMGLGIYMGANQDFTLHNVHAHTNLVGWVSMFLFGLFYRFVPSAEGRLARVQYAASITGFLLMIPSVAMIETGHPQYEPGAIVGSLLTISSMAIFAWIVYRTTRRTPQA